MAHQGYDNARQRRNDKRLALTAAYNAQHGIVEPESREIKHPTLRLNRKPASRRETPARQSENSRQLRPASQRSPEDARSQYPAYLVAAGFRNVREDCYHVIK